MVESWRIGTRVPAETFLARLPDHSVTTEEAVRLVYEEVCLRQDLGQEVNAEELAQRFPQWAEELGVLLDCHRLLRSYSVSPQFPDVGETLGDFRLVAELGRGAQGRIYLARQQALSDRPVVLKVTPRRAHEHLSLARLQHTHIIPLHAIYEFHGRNLRAMCMPYLGGATLERILQFLQPRRFHELTGLSIVEAIDTIQNEVPIKTPFQERFRQILARSSYVNGICLIGACLADGLQYAHERNLVHLDIKPSNVLLTADAQPLLLDFHLAVHPLQAGQDPPEWFGGTPYYMSPEHEQASAAARTGKPLPVSVDGRSDIYSLGKLLHVALSGGQADKETGRQEERARLPRVPMSPCPLVPLSGIEIGLSDIVQKCLAEDPVDRYQDATALAADLRRHLADLPLVGVSNRSWRERYKKWRRRRPYTPLAIGLLLALFACGTILSAFVVDRWQVARSALALGQNQINERQYQPAVYTLSQANDHLLYLPGFGDLKRSIATQLDRAQGALAANDLHEVVEDLRFFATAEKYPGAELGRLDVRCRKIWDRRHQLVTITRLVPDPDLEERVHTDLIDLAVIWSDLHRQVADHRTSPELVDEGKQILAEAEQLIGGSKAVNRQRALLNGGPITTTQPNDKSASAKPASATAAWEYVILGRSLLRHGDLDQAANELQKAIELRPQDPWANFYKGVCDFRRKHYSEAVQSFSIAIALTPDSAECYYNRGLARAGAGQNAAALHDYDKALELKPALGAAALNRGSLHYQDGRYANARDDIEYALGHGADPAAAHYNLALVFLATKQDQLAKNELEQVLRFDSTHVEAQNLLRKFHR
jgi:serine/threonine protein kinase/Flp pilus assembly protein TadD